MKDKKISELNQIVEELSKRVDKISSVKYRDKIIKNIIQVIYSLLLIAMVLFSELDHQKMSILLDESQRVMQSALIIAEN
jgi:hypothetical protein